jgi:arsenate reductase-like glutaredoxin family protein
LQAGIQFSDRDFFKQRFLAQELEELLGEESPRAIFNFKSMTFRKSGLNETALTDDDLLRLLVEEPRFFKRPLVVIDGRLQAGANAKKLGAELGFEIEN